MCEGSVVSPDFVQLARVMQNGGSLTMRGLMGTGANLTKLGNLSERIGLPRIALLLVEFV
jgi:hypothetical protein